MAVAIVSSDKSSSVVSSLAAKQEAPLPKYTIYADSKLPNNGSFIEKIYYGIPLVSTLLEKGESKFNSATILQGASNSWDAERIHTGKEAEYIQIGATLLQLNPGNGDKINGSYFDTSIFMNSVTKLGGKYKSVDVVRNQPFLQYAKFAKLREKDTNKPEIDAVVFDNLDEMEKKDLTGLTEYCQKIDYNCAYLSDGTEVFLYDKNLYQATYGKSLKGLKIFILNLQDKGKFKAQSSREINYIDEVPEAFLLFSPKTLHINAIVFEGDYAKAQSLFRFLKIEGSAGDFLDFSDGKIGIMSAEGNLLRKLKRLNPDEYELRFSDSSPPDTKKAGVVLLCMNQTASYFQISSEVLTFLLSGINVMVYDTAGKALSLGLNSQKRLREDIEIAYSYLVKVKGFNDNQVMVKGQCAGGPIASELAKSHPRIHLWLDQCPRNYRRMIDSLLFPYACMFLRIREESDKAKRIKNISSFLTKYKITRLVSLALPNFDVVDNIYRKHMGKEIYNIGVPDDEGNGGDKLVPDEHRIAILKCVQSNSGVYITMPGASHVTNWWTIPSTKKECEVALSQLGLLAPFLGVGKAEKSELPLVEKYYQTIFKKAFDEKTSTDEQYLIYQIMNEVGSKSCDTTYLVHLVDGYWLMYGKTNLYCLFNASLELAKESGNRKAALYFIKTINEVKKGSIEYTVSKTNPQSKQEMETAILTSAVPSSGVPLATKVAAAGSAAATVISSVAGVAGSLI